MNIFYFQPSSSLACPEPFAVLTRKSSRGVKRAAETVTSSQSSTQSSQSSQSTDDSSSNGGLSPPKKLRRTSRGRSLTRKSKSRSPAAYQLGIPDLFKLKSLGGASDTKSIISTRSKSCSSDFTDGASTCSDLIEDISDDDDVTHKEARSGPNSPIKSRTRRSMSPSEPILTLPAAFDLTMGSPAKLEPSLPALPALPCLPPSPTGVRRSPRESVRQKAAHCPNVTPSSAKRKKLKFGAGESVEKQPKIMEFMKSTKPRVNTKQRVSLRF